MIGDVKLNGIVMRCNLYRVITEKDRRKNLSAFPGVPLTFLILSIESLSWTKHEGNFVGPAHI